MSLENGFALHMDFMGTCSYDVDDKVSYKATSIATMVHLTL